MPSLALVEKEKYEKVWDNPAYRKVSPGELVAKDFRDAIKGSVIDFGCGTGRAALLISEKWPVMMLDHAENCLDEQVKEKLSPRLRFEVRSLWEPYPRKADWGFCCDVLEHIPERYVESVLKNIHNSCREGAYLRVYLHKDNGKFSEDPLHMTVKPFEWWLEQVKSLWEVDYADTNGTVATFWVSHASSTY